MSDQNRQGQEKDAERQSPSEKPAASGVVGGVDPPNGGDRTNEAGAQGQQPDNRPQKSAAERWMVVFTGGIFFATTIYALIAFGQLGAMNGQLTAMNSQLTAINDQSGDIKTQASAAVVAAHAAASAAFIAKKTLDEQKAEATSNETDFNRQLESTNANFQQQIEGLKASISAANRQALAAEKGLTLSQRNFLDEERPYVVALLPQQTINASRNTLSGTLLWRNYGKTPAVQVNTALVIDVDTRSAVGKIGKAFRSLVKVEKHAAGGTVIPPISQQGEGVTNPFTLTFASAQAREYFTGHDNLIIVLGRAVYFDIRKNRHYTDACLALHPSTVPTYCQTHNEMR